MAGVKLEDPSTGSSSSAEGRESVARDSGRLIINADDWGRERETTDRTLECALCGTISSVSAMVFMSDSERAAGIARERGIDTGLHVNLTTLFTGPTCSLELQKRQRELALYLLRHRFSQIVFHPRLRRSFEYVVSAQIDEFHRLYGTAPSRLDGHHHMHLCANVLMGKLIPHGIIVRRNFSFPPGAKSWPNRFYRQTVDHILARHHHLTDFFFSLVPLEPPARLQRIFSLARQFAVEVEVHPANPEEHQFLAGGEIFRFAGDVRIARGFAV